MSENSVGILQHIQRARQQASPAAAPAPDVPGDEDVCLAFGYLRGLRDRALNIVFHRLREGDTVTFPYSWLGPTRLHPSVGLQMLFVGSELFLVTVRGRHLTRPVAQGIDLHERGIVRHRVTWVREMPAEESRALKADECVVDRIEIEAVTPEQAAKVFGIRLRGAG